MTTRDGHTHTHKHRYGQKEKHTWLIKRTALEPDRDMNLNFLTLTASPPCLHWKRTQTKRDIKSGINVVVGAREKALCQRAVQGR